MKNWFLLTVFLLTALVPAGLGASEPVFYMTDDVVKNWKVSREFTLAVAEGMPAQHYHFRPSPEEMSFEELMIHLAASQVSRFSQVSGLKPDFDPPQAHATREDIIRYLRQSFDFCIARIPQLSERQLDTPYKVDWYNKPAASGREILLAMLVHTAHHRAQAEVYMRIKGLEPPTYRF